MFAQQLVAGCNSAARRLLERARPIPSLVRVEGHHRQRITHIETFGTCDGLLTHEGAPIGAP